MQDIPRILREMLEKGRPDYESLIRQVRWGEGPIYLAGCGAARRIGGAGACAIEELLGWPVLVRDAVEFTLYSLSLLRPRSVLLIVSAAGEAPEAVELARLARARGAIILALTGDAASPLSKASDGVFLLRTEADDASPSTVVSQHAALTYIALLAAHLLKRPSAQGQEGEEEFRKLPDQIDWAFTQLSDALRSLAETLAGRTFLQVVGGGFFRTPAVQGAWRLGSLAGIRTVAGDPWDWADKRPLPSGEPLLVLSGSRSKAKKAVHGLAAHARHRGAEIFAITDRQDRELAERAALTVLVPTTCELVGSTLTLSLLEWVAARVSRNERGRRQPARP